MKGKLGKYLVIALPVLAIILLMYPTWKFNQLDKERGVLDSANRVKWDQSNAEEYKKNRMQALKLGLDLRGGMYVTLEVDAVQLLLEAADQSLRNDETLNQVIAQTRQDADGGSDDAIIDIFTRNFNAIAKPKGKSLINYYDVANEKEISEEAIVEKLKRDIDEAIKQAEQVIRQRVDKYGVTEVNIQRQGTRRLVLELPGVQNEAEMRQLLSTTARLEFKLVRGNTEILRSLLNIDNMLAAKSGKAPAQPAAAPAADTTKADSTKNMATADSAKAAADTTKKTAANDSAKKNDPYAGLNDEQKAKKYRELHPFTSLFGTQVYVNENDRPQMIDISEEVIRQIPPNAQFIFSTNETNKRILRDMLKDPSINRMLPSELEIAIGAKAERGTEKSANPIFSMYILKREPELTGDVVTEAIPRFDQSTNKPEVLMFMNDEGTEKWSKITGANVGKRIAIVLDGEVFSAPNVQNKISGGQSTITGMANPEEANLLTVVLKAGALKAPVKIIEERVVGPSLGEDSIRSGLMASLIAFILVVLFMAVYYRGAGMVANLAVIVNVGLIIAVLVPGFGFGGTLSLPGIAGIILTIGMAVDANILIFERIREELYRGRTMRAAIDEGFRHALPAILDSNVTTFLTGLVLFVMGYGPIKGFALTLMIGIVTTLFTAIVVSRAIIELWLSRKANATIGFGEHPTMKL
ncbi:MAG: protein translocase subunit SecD [Candidatus Kapabacteria bacterium]|nr:protein translocase subunit SecD [Candidatus Kapabacteria bacterium]